VLLDDNDCEASVQLRVSVFCYIRCFSSFEMFLPTCLGYSKSTLYSVAVDVDVEYAVRVNFVNNNHF
jgi:hypothetical protein